MSTTTKTRAAVLVDLNSPLEIMEIDLPALRSGEVLVKVHSTGLCHTQLLEIKGENASGPHNPNLLGHEGSGVVVEVGEYGSGGVDVYGRDEDRVVKAMIDIINAFPEVFKGINMGNFSTDISTFNQFLDHPRSYGLGFSWSQ